MNPTDPIASTADISPHDSDDPAISESKAIPNRAYTSHDEWLKERDTVIAQTWAGLGFSSDIAQPGSVHPVMFMGLPLVMVRHQRGRAGVFHNVCRHRGMQLVVEAGDAGWLSGVRIKSGAMISADSRKHPQYRRHGRTQSGWL